MVSALDSKIGDPGSLPAWFMSRRFLPKLKVAQARGLGFQKGGGLCNDRAMYKRLGRANAFRAQWFRLWTRRPGIHPRTLHLHQHLFHYHICCIQWNKDWCRYIILFFIIRCLSPVPRINSRGIPQGLLNHNIIVKIGLEQICLDSLGFLSILYDAEITWSFEKLTEAGIWNRCVTCEYIRYK